MRRAAAYKERGKSSQRGPLVKGVLLEMADALTPDICVIGGGPSGIAAARAAAAEGVSVVLVEKRALGGANLAEGAVPLAALMAAAGLSDALRRGPAMGVSGAPLQVNLAKTREHIVGARAALAAGISAGHLAAEGIKVIAARARFLNQSAVAAGEAVIRARRFILAVGSRAAAPDLPGIANVDHLAAAEAFDFARKPSHLIVLGATAHGLALAQAHQRLGIDTTVIDEGPVLPDEDAELAGILRNLLAREGLRVRAGVKVDKITRRRGGLRVALRDPAEGDIVVDGSHLLLAAGRRPAIDGLGLDTAGIAHDDTAIAVRGFRTANRRVYAIGDAIAGPASVARAEAEARAVVRSILLRLPVRHDPLSVRATQTDPALASVGLGEAGAGKTGRVRIWRYPFAEGDRAVAERVPEGVLKVIASEGGRILGAAALGRDAAEHIALWSLAIGAGLSLPALADLRAAYPTRADVARALAASAQAQRLTGGSRKRIIRFLGKFG
jgi:pyruvate/2-oxoglutarate dehydrogenase complex dihydrolipoamide dehydrogenase (E3) component